VAYLGFGKGGAWRARRARAYNVGLAVWKRPSNIVEFCNSCWKMAKTHLFI